jgi:cytoskeletal protein RodZ
MADAVQSLNRNRAVFIFAVGLILLVALFLGGLYFGGQRSDQLIRLASADKLASSSGKNNPTHPTTEPNKDISPKPEKETPPKKAENKPTITPKPHTADPIKPTPTPRSNNDGSLPVTGPSTVLLSIPVLLIVGYAFYEYNRSRQAIARAAFHENSAF